MRLLEEVGSLQGLIAGELLVLSRSTATAAAGYQLDVLVRQGAEVGVAAIVLRRSTARSLTAEAIARRTGVALLDVGDEIDPAEVAYQLSALAAGDSRTALRQLAGAAAYDADHYSDPEEAVERIGQLCGVDLHFEPTTSEGGAVVEVDGLLRGVVTSVDRSDVAVVAARLAADAATLTLIRRDRRILNPMRTTSAALVQLLLCSQANVVRVAERALHAGLPVDGWHCSARLTLVDLALTDATPGELPQLESDVLRWTAENMDRGRGIWSVARPDESVVLMRSTKQDPRGDATRFVSEWMERLAHALSSSYPDYRVMIGISTAHQGPAGLRLAAAESRTSLASARLSSDPVSIATFDSLGTQRMLAEWLASDTARETVRDLLAPLDALGPSRAATAIETLHAYLDERGSLQRAAARLHVHRNAVAYRMTQINEVLQVDLSDPDSRFALQLACRARLMTAGR